MVVVVVSKGYFVSKQALACNTRSMYTRGTPNAVTLRATVAVAISVTIHQRSVAHLCFIRSQSLLL